MSTEADRWSALGEQQPYWTVLVDDQYRTDAITPEAVRAFFATGEAHVAAVLAARANLLGLSDVPATVLDFGCGVGRLSLPFAKRGARVVGVDLSDGMLARAREHAAQEQLANTEFLTTPAFVAREDLRFGLIHSYITLQHVPPADGLALTKTMLQRLLPGGSAILHYTYAWRASWVRRVVRNLRRRLWLVDAAAKLARGRSLREPTIPMFEYDLAELFELFQDAGCSRIALEFTNHGGHLGAVIYARKAG